MAFTQRKSAAGGPKYDPKTNPAPRDQDKYKATADVKFGEKLSKDPAMRAEQDKVARAKAKKFYDKHKVQPTAANVKKFGGY
jgi:hypothetical protein